MNSCDMIGYRDFLLNTGHDLMWLMDYRDFLIKQLVIVYVID